MKHFFSLMILCLFSMSVWAVETQTNEAPSATEEARVRPVHSWRQIAISDSQLVAQEPRHVESLDALVKEAFDAALNEAEHKSTSIETVWGTVLDCRDPRDPRIGSYRGTEPVYPASVIKMCYMVTAFDQNRLGLLEMDADLKEDLQKMIGPSDNYATNRILDRLANTSAGEELQGEARDSFTHKRQVTYRHMQQLGLTGLWPVNKTYAGDIRLYGREKQFLGESKGGNYERSNKMTTDDTARLLYLIWRHAVVDYDACEEMLDLMHRVEDRPRTFFSSIKPEGWEHYSKDGSTGVQRHEAALFLQPNGAPIIIVLFSNHLSVQNNQYGRVIQRAAEMILERLAASPGQLDAQ